MNRHNSVKIIPSVAKIGSLARTVPKKSQKVNVMVLLKIYYTELFFLEYNHTEK